jgi:tight adherence protein C
MAMNPVLLVSIVITALCAAGLLVVLYTMMPSRHAKRLMEVTRTPTAFDAVVTTEDQTNIGQRALDLVRSIRTRFRLEDNEKLRQRLIAAGRRSKSDIDLYFGLRLLAPLVALVGATFIPGNNSFWMVVLPVVGYMVPDMCLTQMTKRRREDIRLSMPDAVDLMVICVEAGLGLDQALLRAGQELAISHRAISEEFMTINVEQRAGKARLEAWQGMSDRTRLDIVKNFVSMLGQTDRFGTPIVKALSVFSDSMRTKRRQQAEEMAAKTTVKLIFPLVLFIFPSIFIVLLGPAFLTIARSLNTLFH